MSPKTEFMIISWKPKLNDCTININVDGVQINRTNHSKSLGLNIDENLSWKAHVHKIWKTSRQVSVQLSESGHLYPWTLQLKYTKALYEPHFDYCNVVWDGGVIRSKNFRIALSDLINIAGIRVPDISLTRLVGTTCRLKGLKKRLT